MFARWTVFMDIEQIRAILAPLDIKPSPERMVEDYPDYEDVIKSWISDEDPEAQLRTRIASRDGTLSLFAYQLMLRCPEV